MSSSGPIAPGSLIADRFRVLEVLAGEGSGAVFRALDARAEREVAMRIIPIPASVEDRERNLRQGKLAARLLHPNVARTVDFGVDAAAGVQYAAADAGPGGTMAALLAQRGAPPLPLALRIVEEAAAGLASAHIAGAVHGDVHPGMLWLARNEGKLRAVIVGFGIDPGATTPGRSTARYCAPERLRRLPVPSPATDVFSLGVMAYEVLAGLPADWTATLLAMAKGGEPAVASPSDRRQEIAPHVGAAILRALAPDPARRWATAGEFAAALAPPATAVLPMDRPAASERAPAMVRAEPQPAARPRIHLNVPIIAAPDLPAAAAVQTSDPVPAAAPTDAAPSSAVSVDDGAAEARTADAEFSSILTAALDSLPVEDLEPVMEPAVADSASSIAAPARQILAVGSKRARDERPEVRTQAASTAAIVTPDPTAATASVDLIAPSAALPSFDPAYQIAPPPRFSTESDDRIAQIASTGLIAPSAAPLSADSVDSVDPIDPIVPAASIDGAETDVAASRVTPAMLDVSSVAADPAVAETVVASVVLIETAPVAPAVVAAPVASGVAAKLAPPIAPAQSTTPAASAMSSANPRAPVGMRPAPAHKLTASRTDLADSLYIPPSFGDARTPAPVSAPVAPIAQKVRPPLAVPAVPPAGTTPTADPQSAAAAPAQQAALPPIETPADVYALTETRSVPVDDGHAAPAVAVEETRIPADETLVAPSTTIIPFPSAPVAVEAARPETPAPAAVLPMRKSGLSRLGAQPRKSRAGLLAAGIAVVVLGGGALAARTVLGGATHTPAVTQRLASGPAVAAAPVAAHPSEPLADSGVITPSVTDPAIPQTAAEQKRAADEKRKQEQLRRDQQRRADSLRIAQNAVRNQPAMVPTVAAPPAVLAERPAPIVEQRAPAPAPAPIAAPAAPAPARVDPSRVYSPDELDQRPSLRNRADLARAVLRSYPSSLVNSGTAGGAVVQFVVLPDGRVDRGSVRVTEVSHPAFRVAAAAAISAARFEPARVDGQAVRAEVSIPLTWNPN